MPLTYMPDSSLERMDPLLHKMWALTASLTSRRLIRAVYSNTLFASYELSFLCVKSTTNSVFRLNGRSFLHSKYDGTVVAPSDISIQFKVRFSFAHTTPSHGVFCNFSRRKKRQRKTSWWTPSTQSFNWRCGIFWLLLVRWQSSDWDGR